MFIQRYDESLIKLEIDTFKAKVNVDGLENGIIEFSVQKYTKVKYNWNMFFSGVARP